MNLQEKTEIINALQYDLRAEYLVSSLLDNEMSRNDVLVFFDGILKRKWSSDVNKAEAEVFENGMEALCLHLNRAGIYDTLPEALFHANAETHNASGEEMAKESLKLRLEEKEIRSFFRPFENELFMQNVHVALEETREWKSLCSDFLQGLIPDFWKIDPRIPFRYAYPFVRFLPMAYQLVGRYNLTAQCLELILGEKVKMELHNNEKESNGKAEEDFQTEKGTLGDCKLGTNLITGETVSGCIGKLKVYIGPLKKTRPNDFLPDRPVDLMLASFYGYFVPVDLEVETKILAPEVHGPFILKHEDQPGEAFLGYNTVL
jgi:hypothetical protein